ncbi:MAG: leucyl aminopeptidase [Terracidiphilus sp.]
MKTQLSFSPLAEIETRLLAVLAVDTQTSKAPDAKPQPVLLTADPSVIAAAEAVLASGEFKAGANETLLWHGPDGIAAKRLLIVGLGKQSKATANSVRNAAGTAIRFAKPRSIRELVLALPQSAVAGSELESLSPALCARAAVEGALVGDFDPDTYRSERKDQSVQSFTLVAPIAPPADADKKVDAEKDEVADAGEAQGKKADENKTDAEKTDAREADAEGAVAEKTDQDQKYKEMKAAIEAAFAEGVILGESQNFARSLVNEPGNKLTPTILARRAMQMAEEVGLKCQNYSTDKLHDLKMGAFWSVSQGSAEPPALIVLRYEPKGVTEGPVLGLVGKGITFDSGGISIKPSDNMEKMKYDMAGGAAMIGAMRAVALLKPQVRVICIVCAAENMPSGTAQKPGDVQTAMPLSPSKPGKTIEIINTDAEGRLVLADGLTYARQLGATHLIDAATLTGACVVALGYVNAGAFSNDDATWGKFDAALATSGEKFWRLPLGDEYAELIKSDIGDIKNTGGRWGGAITAAEFLKVFVDDTPWIHLDIAGLAWVEDSKPYIAKGPSGVAVRSILEWVRSYQTPATSA